MVTANIAVELDEKVYMSKDGIIVDNPNHDKNNIICDKEPNLPLGLPCSQQIVHPEYLLFFDETGCNTNQKKDGHNGGQKFGCGRGTTPKQISSTSDKHFTLLGLTAGTGEAVLCVIIFASERTEGVVANWAEGIDITIDPVKDENGEIVIGEVNFGEGKYFPSGPTCKFRGKNIPYLPLASPSGGITGLLLVEILKYLDSYNIYDCQVGEPSSFLIVDGHESRLNPIFVEYITNPDHIWHVNLGTPHATSYWQVGDSSEQNGLFKMLLTEAKKELVNFKIKHGMPIYLGSEDIVPLVNKAWGKSFGNIETSRKAIAARGWNPLNRNLLLNKEIKATMTNNEDCEYNTGVANENSTSSNITSNSTITAESEETTTTTTIKNIKNNLPLILNTSDGVSGMCFQKLVQHCLKHGGIDRNRENLEKGESIRETFAAAKRISSGIMVRRGIHEVNEPNIASVIKGNQIKIKEQQDDLMRRRRKEIKERIDTITKLRLTKPCVSEWNQKECGAFIQYKKRKGDSKMPKSLKDLRARCVIIEGRSSPDCSVHDSDESDDDNDDIQTCNNTSSLMFDRNHAEIGDFCETLKDAVQSTIVAKI